MSSNLITLRGSVEANPVRILGLRAGLQKYKYFYVVFLQQGGWYLVNGAGVKSSWQDVMPGSQDSIVILIALFSTLQRIDSELISNVYACKGLTIYGAPTTFTKYALNFSLERSE